MRSRSNRFLAVVVSLVVLSLQQAVTAGAQTTTIAPTTVAPTTAPPTTVPPTTNPPTTVSPTTVPPTTAPPTTVAPTTTTTAPPTPGPRGPGNGPLAILPQGGLTSAPDAAALPGQERVDVVAARGTSFNATFWTGTAWSAWADLGSPPGGAQGDPTIVSWAPGRLDVFARGNDGRLWQTFSENGGASWSGWIKPLGDEGELAGGSSPEASTRGPGRLDIFVRGTDGQIWQRFYDGAWNDGWLPQGAPGAGITGDPGAVSWSSSDVHIFVRGGDNKLWERFWTGFAWTDWAQATSAGTLDSSPDATTWGPGTLLVFVRGTDGGIYVITHGAGIWSDWVRLVGTNDVIVGAPGATSRGDLKFDVFGRGTDNVAYQVWQ